MKTWNYLKYDLSQNLVKMFVVAVCLSILVCVYLYDVQGFFVEMKENGVGNGMGSFFDYLAHFFCGEYEYELTASSEFFLPVDWLAYNGLIAYLVGFYSYEDMTRYGKISILYGGSKKSFFAAKILFQLLMVFWCYFVIYMNMALYVVAHSFRLEFSPTKAIWENTMTRLFEYDSKEKAQDENENAKGSTFIKYGDEWLKDDIGVRIKDYYYTDQEAKLEEKYPDKDGWKQEKQ